ncbi:MAG: type III pantothenate kinase [Chromatiales bacterium]|nr:type III pantothenate kinase [Chromatiales bacterium]
MMLLADIGNNREKWAIGDNGELAMLGNFTTGDTATLSALLARCPRDRIHRVVVASVAGTGRMDDVTRTISAAGLPEVEVINTPEAGGGIRVAYAEPQRLGCDRFLAMVAAHARYAGPLVVVDCGTAVTLDAVDAEGVHLGGAILPGRALMQSALMAGTVGVQFEAADSSEVFGKDTAAGVASGAHYGLAGAIDGIVERMAAAFPAAPTLVITGGDGPTLEPLLKHRYHGHPELVLEGLAIYADT